MSTLFGNNISQTYQGLIKLADSTTGVTATTQSLQDGLGNNIPIQVSNTTVNISGSFLVNGQPVSFTNTGSFATTGSNTFIGDQTITGSVNVSNIKGTGSLFLQPNQADARFVEIYNTSPTDTHITASGGQIFLGDDVTYVKVDNYGSVKHIDIVADNGVNISGSVQVTGSLDITGTITANSASFNYLTTIFETASIIYSSGSNQLGDELTDIQTLSGSVQVQGELLVNGVPVVTGSVNRDGLITTGSISSTQQITGSLILDNTIISGSLIGNALNGGLIKIQTEANRNGPVQFNITSSLPVSSSNIVMGQIGQTTTQTGSVVISGSNNILFNGFRQNTLLTQGTYGYITSNNIVSTIPTLNTGSLIRPTVSNNQLNSLLNMNFTTSSVVNPVINNNLIYGPIILNSQSGSVSYNNNINTSTVTVNQNTQSQTGSNTTILNNNFGGSIILNAISSSIRLTNNTIFGTNTFVTSSYFNSSSYFSTSSFNNEGQVQQNIIGGFNNHIQFGGNPATNVARSFSTNILGGINNIVNMDATGSNTNMFSSLIYGQSLSVNPKQQIDGMAVLGKYNKTITGSTIFVVGNGTGTGDRRNAIEVTTNDETIISGSVNISGSLTLNGVAIGGSGDRNGLITTGSATTYPTQTIAGTLQISSGSLFARGRNTSANNLAYGEFALENITTANSNTGLGNNALRSATSGGGNLAVGGSALSNMTTGINNVGIGNQALLNNISGSNNTAIGANTLQNNVAGFNLAIGTDALKFNTTGQYNNAIGDASLFNNTTGDSNLAIGKNTLFSNTTGGSNVGIGGGALSNNVSGSNNTAVGISALGNSVSSFNLAIGGAALSANTTGQYNVGIGNSAAQANTIGERNISIGYNSLVNNITGSTNTAIGAQALQQNFNGSGNVAIGNSAGYNSTGSNGFYVGNENYGSLSNEQNKSLMYGEFNSTTANQSLQINATTTIKTGNLIAANNLVVTGSVDIIGNFPADPGKTFVIRSGSMKMGDFNNSVRIADLNNQPQLFFNGTRKVGFFLGQSNMDQVDTQFGIVSGSENIYTMGGNFNNFRSGSNNLMLGVNNISIKSGSNNIILANQTSYTTGSNNLILGSLQGVDEAQDYFNLQLPQSNDPIMFKSGSAPLTISGSLNVTSNAIITGSLRVSGDVMFSSGSNKTMGTVALDGGNPGTATVSNSLVTANSLIFLTKQTNNHPNAGPVVVSSKGSGTFTITSNHNSDNDVVAYQIINPA